MQQSIKQIRDNKIFTRVKFITSRKMSAQMAKKLKLYLSLSAKCP